MTAPEPSAHPSRLQRGAKVGTCELAAWAWRAPGVDAWHATDAGGAAVLVQVAVGLPHGRERLARAARVLEGFVHAGAPRLVAAHLDADPPHLVTAITGEGALRGPLAPADALAAIAALASMLAAAHATARWNPDVRPGTILGPPAGPIATDWGTAWQAGMDGGPEAHEAVARDVLALGRLLFALLTGLPAAPRDLDPGEGFPEDLRGLVRRLTGPIDARPRTAREVAFALRALRTEPHVSGTPAPEARRRYTAPRKMLRRPEVDRAAHPGHAVGLLALLVVWGCVFAATLAAVLLVAIAAGV